MRKNLTTGQLYFLAIGFCLLVLGSCEEDLTNRNDFVPDIIVDGRIESNGYPRVFLTRNIPYYVNIDSTDIIYLVLRQAKVTVSDGVNSEVLTLMYNKKIFPPYYYQGTEFLGQAGNTYQLTINYGTDTLTATTTIPNPVIPDSVWFQPKSDEPDKGQVLVKIHDNSNEKNFYKIYTLIKGEQKDYTPALISNFDDQMFNGEVHTFYLDKGPETYLNLKDKDFSFSKNDTISVKLCTLDKTSFDFWWSYQNGIANGANPFASSFHEVKSNIKGGLGVWSGFGTTVKKIVAK